MVTGCRSSGLIAASALIYSGRVKLVSVHATNMHTTQDATLIVYDNTAASGTQVLSLVLEPKKSIECDMHGVICSTGLYASFGSGPGGSAGTPVCTVEFA
jgi:hypothetical protein